MTNSEHILIEKEYESEQQKKSLMRKELKCNEKHLLQNKFFRFTDLLMNYLCRLSKITKKSQLFHFLNFGGCKAYRLIDNNGNFRIKLFMNPLGVLL